MFKKQNKKARRDFTYCIAKKCNRRKECIRWAGNYEFDGGEYSMMNEDHCVENGYFNFYRMKENE